MSFIKKLKIARFFVTILLAFVLVMTVTSTLKAPIPLEAATFLSLAGVVLLTLMSMLVVNAMPCSRLYFGPLAVLVTMFFLTFIERFLSTRVIWWYVLYALEAPTIILWMLTYVAKRRADVNSFSDFPGVQACYIMATDRFIKWMRDEWPGEMTMLERALTVTRMVVILALFFVVVIVGVTLYLMKTGA